MNHIKQVFLGVNTHTLFREALVCVSLLILLTELFLGFPQFSRKDNTSYQVKANYKSSLIHNSFTYQTQITGTFLQSLQRNITNVRIILTCILKITCDCINLFQIFKIESSINCSCEHSNEFQGSIKQGEFLEKMSYQQLLKNISAPLLSVIL